MNTQVESSLAALNLLSSNISVLYLASFFLFVAVTHALFTSKFALMAHWFPKHTISNKIFHFLSEVEVVFGFWAFVFLSLIAWRFGMDTTIAVINNTDFKEAIFAFAVMCISATKPVIDFAEKIIVYCSTFISKIFKINKNITYYNCLFILGPLSGSFLTEPVAMTLTAMLAKESFFDHKISTSFKYTMLGLIFVSVSIGGTLSYFAAPPVLMVAEKWGWGMKFMFFNFGLKALIVICISSILTSIIFRKQIQSLSRRMLLGTIEFRPAFVSVINILFIVMIVIYHKYASFVIALFLLFLGWYEVTKEFQKQLKIRESLLVGFFLAGLVVLGSFQGWWIKPLISQMGNTQIFFGAAILSAFTDNAAITFLASQMQNITDAQKYAVVAGAVTGGGLTVMANAPNPIGYGILGKSFGPGGIKPTYLFLYALPFTMCAVIAYVFF